MSRTKALKNVKLTSFDDLFGGKVVEETAETGDVKEIPLSELHEFHNHPFQVRSDEELEEMIESVREHGVLVPGIVRKREQGGYEIIAAASVDNRVFVLKEDGEKMFWQEYLPEDNLFEDAGTVCPFAASDIYGTPVVISGKIYMAKTEETKEVLVHDAYSDEWSRISDMNLTKKDSMLAASGNDIYSIGGELVGFGVLDTVEQYTVKVQTITKQMAVNQGESYELQVNAGNLKKGQAKIVTVNVNPEEMKIQNASSFETEDTLKEGADGVTLLKYQPKKGVIVLKLTGSLERGESYETYQSIPVEAKITGKTTVEITLTEEGK